MSNKQPFFRPPGLLVGIILVASTLRPTITSVGPLIPMIRSDLGLSNGLAGFLTTLPLITFATFSLFSASIGRFLGYARAILVGMVLLAIGLMIRVLGGSFLLFLGTGLTGVGIVICNVLLIPLVKVRMPGKVGKITGVYATVMTMVAAIASAVTVPLAVDLGLNWRGSLLFWIVLLIIAIICWIPQVMPDKTSRADDTTVHPVNVWKSKLAWQVSLFMGVQSLLFFTLVAWLPDLFISRGVSPINAGFIMSLMQLSALIGTFLAPIIAVKFNEQSHMILGLAACYLLGYGSLFSGDLLWNISGICLAGLCMGASLSMAYTLISLRSGDDRTTAALSGMAQSTGYYLAALGPVLFGMALDRWQNWDHLIYLLLITSLFFAGFGYFAGKNRVV
ncbi:Cyanate transport system protein [Lunatimonas lonarensis]|uniref:Cyanate transport system protein n=1 Tax=Lunatimonas lonarensis TaxID=1232681 RepID=R7ZYE9_9BACT|nr:MFS transporter [Lunatimonas lonarensis]EON79122.1 Cyanate transport system protein [Lunatimonas lonarensis]